MVNITTTTNKESPTEKRILVCDDDEHIRAMVEVQLQLEGFQVKTARDAKNVLKNCLEFQPHLIITDLMMPGGGGYELIRTLQSDPLTSKIPVLMISGANIDKTTKAMLTQEPNMVGFLEKPLHLNSFTMKIHQTLNTKTKEERMIEDQQRLGDINLDKFNF